MISRVIDQSFVATLISLNPIFMTIEDGILDAGLIIVLGIYMTFIFICYSLVIGKYTIYNINSIEATLLLEEILTDKNYNEEGIKIESSFLNTVELNLKEIRGTQKYDDILHELKGRLQSTKKSSSPILESFI